MVEVGLLARLEAKPDELFARPPVIERVDLLAVKFPKAK